MKLLLLLLLIGAPQDKVADEFVKLARFCVAQKAYRDARVELRSALALVEGGAAEEELKNLEGLADEARPDAAKKIDDERRKAHAAIEKLGFAWYAPYSRWLPKGDATKLEAGQEQIDGQWTEKAAVAALDKKHGSWDDPWVLDDGVHEIKSTLPYRATRRLLSYASAYRAFFLSQFGEWDLRVPTGKLPIVATATQAELRDVVGKHTNGAVDVAKTIHGSAYYLYSPQPLNPCFVTLEPTDSSGAAHKVSIEDAIRSLTHELTHQICFEFSKHDSDLSRPVKHGAWAVEGLAAFMPAYLLEKGRWRLAHVKKVGMGDANVEGPFAWAQGHAGTMAPIEKLAKMSRQEFPTGENYNTSATLAYFLLLGDGGKQRGRFVKLLEAVHKIHDSETLFDETFQGVDKGALQREFLKFVAGLKLE